MDIYVERRKRKLLVKALCKLLGIPTTSCTPVSIGADTLPYDTPGICAVYSISFQGRQIQIIESAYSTAQSAVPYFHTTLVMNILAYDHISVAYPKLTLKQEGILHPDPVPNIGLQVKALFKYIKRGYRLQYHIQGSLPFADDTTEEGEFCASSYVCCRERRSFYDSKSLVLPIGGGVVMQPRKRAMWTLGGLGCGMGCVPFRRGTVMGYVLAQTSPTVKLMFALL